MDLTTIILIGLFVWMMSMHLRPGGHGGCGSHGSQGSKTSGKPQSGGQHSGH